MPSPIRNTILFHSRILKLYKLRHTPRGRDGWELDPTTPWRPLATLEKNGVSKNLKTPHFHLRVPLASMGYWRTMFAIWCLRGPEDGRPRRPWRSSVHLVWRSIWRTSNDSSSSWKQNLLNWDSRSEKNNGYLTSKWMYMRTLRRGIRIN